MQPKSMRPLVICYGELLWDVYKDIEQPGGTPLNIIYHLQKLKKKACLFHALAMMIQEKN